MGHRPCVFEKQIVRIFNTLQGYIAWSKIPRVATRGYSNLILNRIYLHDVIYFGAECLPPKG